VSTEAALGVALGLAVANDYDVGGRRHSFEFLVLSFEFGIHLKSAIRPNSKLKTQNSKLKTQNSKLF
jgi:hypothetical protein